jgi:5-methylcytosine-specific restriction endonuclease McrA
LTVETECSVCGNPRPNRGTCLSCGTRLCSTCRNPLPRERTSWNCYTCAKEYMARRTEADPNYAKDNDKRWRDRNPDAARSRTRKWYKNHPLNKAECDRRWRETNPEKHREKQRRRRAKHKGCVVSDADIRVVIERSAGLCALCRTFVPEGLRHIDHIIPLDKGGPHSQENLQLTCYRCNASKGAKMPDEVKPERWVKEASPDQPFLINPNWR